MPFSAIEEGAGETGFVLRGKTRRPGSRANQGESGKTRRPCENAGGKSRGRRETNGKQDKSCPHHAQRKPITERKEKRN